MERKLFYKNKNHLRVFYPATDNKKGVSTIIVTVILVALVMVIGAVVWTIVNNLIRGQTKGMESCFGVFDKVTINEIYTCYNDNADSVSFSLSLGDIDVEKVIVVISSVGETKSFEITNTEQTIANLANYGSIGFGTDLIKLPSKNGGKTYITNYFTTSPDSIKIAPVIKGKQCEASDELTQIEDC